LAALLGGEAPAGGADLGAGPLIATLGWTVGKVGIFIALMLIVGTRLLPWLLGQVTRTGSRELFTLAVAVVALGVAFGSAELFDVSFALGAFFAGMVINASEYGRRAAAELKSLQDAFAVLFFVSVGMLFDPAVLLSHPLEVASVLVVIILGKSVVAFTIVLLFRYPLKTALTISASLAQIGEFSFILGALGISLHVLPPEGLSLIVAGALLSITINPFLFRAVAGIQAWRSRRNLQSSPTARASDRAGASR
jgi:CPA2 family monovalent cation:H+ antiporter-2